MKDRSAFEESVFNKSNIVFEKRKKRRKTITALATSSVCLAFICTLLLRSPADFNFAPTKESAVDFDYALAENAGGHYNKTDNCYEEVRDASDGDKKTSEPETPQEAPNSAETQAVSPSTEAAASESTKLPLPVDTASVFVQIKTFGGTVTAYKDEEAIEDIKLALTKYLDLKERSGEIIAEVTVTYEDGGASFPVGEEFFDILDALRN